MRRTVSIVMMLLASFMILAYSIVPHHHHDQVPVALVHLHDGAVDAHSDAPEHAHHHGDADEDWPDEQCFGRGRAPDAGRRFLLEVQESLSEHYMTPTCPS